MASPVDGSDVVLHEYRHLCEYNKRLSVGKGSRREKGYNIEFDAALLAVEWGFGKDLATLLNRSRGFNPTEIAKRTDRHPSVLARVGRIGSLIG